MQEINGVISSVGPIFGRSPEQIFAMAFLVLWFVLELVGAVVSARQQNQLDELSRDVRQQQLVLEAILEETSPSYSIYPLAPGERSERRARRVGECRESVSAANQNNPSTGLNLMRVKC